MRFLLKCLFLAIILISPQAFAQNADEPLVNIRILAERGQIEANDEIWIATEQVIASHWHTYWKNPGDSGTPASIQWNLPEGFEISDIHWPTPEKISYAPLLNYGYENRVALLQKLKTPENIPAGSIELTVDIELLVCKEECIPEYGTHTLTLNGPNASDENNASFIETARKKLPLTTDWTPTFKEDDGVFSLTFENIPETILNTLEIETIELLPIDWGAVDNTAPATALLENNTLTLTQKRGDRSLSDLKTFSGILTAQNILGQNKSFEFEGTPDPSVVKTVSDLIETPATQEEHEENTFSEASFLQAFLYALIGGLILNLMPCVFPVLSIKALSLVKAAEKHPAHARMLGLSYTAGVILSFLAIAGLLIVLKGTGEQIGWGFQLQNPFVVGLLAYLLFIIGLNLSGLFEFANPFGNTGGTLAQKDGATGSFFTGVLATLVATPCTAPFMATALGYALVQPAYVSLLIFSALGLGLALPYLALSFVPSLQNSLPKPGPWMDTFKQLLAFPMYAAAIWMTWVLGELSDAYAMATILVGMLTIAFAIWIFSHKPANKTSKLIITILSIALAIGSIAILPQTTIDSETMVKTEKTSQNEKFGDVFSQDKLDHLLSTTTEPIFVEMTAAWCITCKVNNATSININSTKQVFAQNNVKYMVGDWTKKDAEISQYLDQHNRKGVPLYVYYGPKNPETKERPAPKVLPQILTPQIMRDLFI